MEGQRHLALATAGAGRLILPAESATEATDVIHPTDAQRVRHHEGLRTVEAGELLWMGATECRSPAAFIRGAFGPLFGVLLVPCLGVPVGVLSEAVLALRCRLRLSGLGVPVSVVGETGLALRCRLRLSGLGETLGVRRRDGPGAAMPSPPLWPGNAGQRRRRGGPGAAMPSPPLWPGRDAGRSRRDGPGAVMPSRSADLPPSLPAEPAIA